MSAAAARALRVLGSAAVEYAPLGARTTYRVGGTARIFVSASSVTDLHAVARARHASGLPVLVLGRGSNLLVADAGFDGIAVSLDGFDTIIIDATTVTAGGGVALPVLARTTARAALAGLEWAVGVPGSVGGGVRMNAGGHGSDIAANLVGVRVFDLGTGEDSAMPTSSLGLRFRSSDLTDDHVVTAATFALEPGNRADSEAQLSEIVRWRRQHQPGGQNAGSVFVNPVPGLLSAGQLIDNAGLRGARLGTAAVSDKHANFIQADDGGRADDVVTLMAHVRATVLDRFGIALHSENRVVGLAEAVSRS